MLINRNNAMKPMIAALAVAPLLLGCTQNLLNLPPNSKLTTPASKTSSKSTTAPMVFSAEITGREVSDIVFKANQGERIQVNLKSPSSFVYFDVYPPGDGKVLFVGQSDAEPTEWVGSAPVSGDYLIRVYQLGGSKTLNTKAAYSVTLQQG